MSKNYTIDVPVNSHPISSLAKINNKKGIHIKLFGGIPDSPFNGGRNNFLLDHQKITGRLFFGVNKGQLLTAMEKFYENIEQVNSQGMSYYLALTNLFVSQEELNPQNIEPIDRLVESSKKYGVKNGLILNNNLLEDFCRKRYGGDLIYTSSCTKYVVPGRILSPQETLKMYLEDLERYDYVVLTPQDSRRERLIARACETGASKIVAICNTYCLNACNCYEHYEFLSQENKKSLKDLKTGDVLIRSLLFALPRIKTCSLYTEAFVRSDYKSYAHMQLRSGVVNFKIGRGLGEDFLGQLVEILQNSSYA